MAAATEHLTPAARRNRSGGRSASGPDRFTVWLLSCAAFLVVLALLAGELRGPAPRTAHKPVVVLRRVYETRVIETVRGPAGGGGGGTSVSQSVSSSGSAAPAPVSTRTS